MALALWGRDSDSDDELQGQLVFMREQTFVRRTPLSEVRCVSRESAVLGISRQNRMVIASFADLRISSPRPQPYYYEKGTLLCRRKNCMVLASFGDQLPGGVKVARKTKCKDTNFLPGVSGDIENIKALMRRDEAVLSCHVYKDFPGAQRSRNEYLKYTRDFLSETKVQASGGMICSL